MARIKHTHIKHETGGGPVIKIKEADDPVYVEDVTISGEAPTEGTRSAIHNYRDDSEFRGVNIDYENDKFIPPPQRRDLREIVGGDS